MFALIFSEFARGPFRSLCSRAGALWLLLLAAGFSGCSTKPLTDPIIGPDHGLKNVYLKEGTLPGSLRRIAVLPLSYNDISENGAAARETLEPIFQSELNKVGRFELFFVKRSQVVLWSGRETWDDFEDLPHAFLKTVAEQTGCDGILFARVSHFKAYPPMVIGWRMRLVTNDAGSVWAVDELFDAAEQAVSNSARRFDRGHSRNNPVLEDSRSILLSPSSFGQYTLSEIFKTIPIR